MKYYCLPLFILVYLSFVLSGCGMSVSPSEVALSQGAPTAAVQVSYEGQGTLTWDATVDTPNIMVNPVGHIGNECPVMISAAQFYPGHVGYVTFSNDADANEFATLKVKVECGTFDRIYGSSGHECFYAFQNTPDGGMVLVGYSTSYGAGDSEMYLVKTDALGYEEWHRTFGGNGEEQANAVLLCDDGGFLLAGLTSSYGAGGSDMYLVKTDAQGNKIWAKTYGGAGEEYAYDLKATSGGGFALAGGTDSPSPGMSDMYLVKTDVSGNELWSQRYGGSAYDMAYALVVLASGEFVLAGNSRSFGAGDLDLLLVKADTDGTEIWTHALGDEEHEVAHALSEVAGGGFVLAGAKTVPNDLGFSTQEMYLLKTDATGNEIWAHTYGSGDTSSVQETADGGFVIAGENSTDMRLVKTDASGNEIWSGAYGGSGWEYAASVAETPEGGFVLLGSTDSYGAGGSDAYLIKTNQVWAAVYGGAEHDRAWDVRHTSDGGYILAGYTSSYGAGGRNMYVVKIDALGNQAWMKTYGGGGWDYALAVQQTTDGGYILAGETWSFGAGESDMYLVKTDAAGNEQWYKTFGGAEKDTAYAVRQCSDGGYILTGPSGDYGSENIYVVKTDAAGNMEWDTSLGDDGSDYGYAVQETGDGGFVIAGEKRARADYSTNGSCIGNFMYLAKLTVDGDFEWEKIYGVTDTGCNFGTATAVQETADGGFALSGLVRVDNNGEFALVRTDASGALLWMEYYGGASSEQGWDVCETLDGGFALVGVTYSYGENGDVFLVKTNAVGTELWSKTFGGEGLESAYALEETPEGGFIIAGSRYGLHGVNENMYVIRTDSAGNAPSEPAL